MNLRSWPVAVIAVAVVVITSVVVVGHSIKKKFRDDFAQINQRVGRGNDQIADQLADMKPKLDKALGQLSDLQQRFDKLEKREAAEDAHAVREDLWRELKPVALQNCSIKRIGSRKDGGYLMCDNLIVGAQSAYSYGIDTEDNWGCEISTRDHIAVHQYDCFTPHRPTCPTGHAVFHDECVGAKTETSEGKPFDSIANQIKKNGDTGKRLLFKMDVEGAEWDSFDAVTDDALDQMDQLVMEMHGLDGQFSDPRTLRVVRRLKHRFWLVSVHFNNNICNDKNEPLPTPAFQVLFINKRLGILDPYKAPRFPGTPPDEVDDPAAPDCQPTAWAI